MFSLYFTVFLFFFFSFLWSYVVIQFPAEVVSARHPRVSSLEQTFELFFEAAGKCERSQVRKGRVS